MRYDFTENKTNRPVASVKFIEADCPAPAARRKSNHRLTFAAQLASGAHSRSVSRNPLNASLNER
jgi:hypothetical protein